MFHFVIRAIDTSGVYYYGAKAANADKALTTARFQHNKAGYSIRARFTVISHTPAKG